jgi:arylsulfatase
LLTALLVALPGAGKAEGIIHDAEYRILETQNGERWARDDSAIDAKLAELREKNGGKPPNIIYILLDDLGFGEIGMPTWPLPVGTRPRTSTPWLGRD